MLGLGQGPHPLSSASFTVGGLSAKRPRTLVFVHPEKKLGKVHKLRGDEKGPPGPRKDYGYAAFVLDPDGHNIEAVVWDEELKAKPKRTRRRKRPPGRRMRSK